MTQQHDRDGQRWKARPVLAALVMTALYAIPLGASSAAVLLLVRANPLPGHRWLSYALLAGTALAVSLVLERGVRRLLPIATLLRLTMLFPDRAPTRFKVARTAATSTRLQSRLRTAGTAAAAAEGALALISALGAHDRRTRGHSERVRVFGDMLAEELHLDQGDRDRLRWASLLHDIGKLQVPPTVLNKPAKLDRDEWAQMKTHPEVGADLTAALLPWLGQWGRGIVEHHERYDGSGYPRGIARADISPSGRIIGLVDAFETMTAARAYKKPMATKAARMELARCAGTQFDPTYVRAFLGVSLPRLLWAMGPLSFLLQLPFLQTIAQAGARSLVAGEVASTVAGAAVIASVGVTGAYGGPLPPVHGTVASNVVETARTRPPRPLPATTRVTRPRVPLTPPAVQTVVPAEPVAGPTVPAVEPTEEPVAGPTVPAVEPTLPAVEPTEQPAGPPLPVEPPSPAGPVLPSEPASPEPSPVTPEPPILGPPLPGVASVTLTAAPAGTVTTPDVALSFTSDDPAAVFSCRLDGRTWQTCASPTGFTLPDGPHTVDVRAVTVAGPGPVTTAAFTVAAAVPTVSAPPTAKIVSGPQTGSAWPSTDVQLQLGADETGVQFQCSTDGTTYADCTAAPTMAFDNGPAQLWVRAVSSVTGTGPSATTGLFTVAQPAPSLEFVDTPTGTVYDTDVTFAFVSDDPAATFTCSVDGATATPCTTTTTLPSLPDGAHTVTVVASNPRTGATPASFSFSTAAEPAVKVGAPTVVGSTATVPFTGTAATSYECSLDAGGWAACTSPATFSGLLDGTHVVSVRGVAAGGPGPSVRTVPFTVDNTTSGAGTFIQAPTGTVIKGTQVFEVPAVAGATYECRVDGAGWTVCSNPASITVPIGPHTVAMRPVFAGAPQPAATTTFTVVDPQVTFTAGPPPLTISRTVLFAFTAAPGLDFECSLNGGKYRACSSPVLAIVSGGPQRLRVRAVDSNGDVGPPATYSWRTI